MLYFVLKDLFNDYSVFNGTILKLYTGLKYNILFFDSSRNKIVTNKNTTMGHKARVETLSH